MRLPILIGLVAVNVLAFTCAYRGLPSPSGATATAFPSATSVTPEQVEARVSSLALSEREEAYRRSGWVYDVEQAKKLSRQTGRKIFICSMFGDLDSRC